MAREQQRGVIQQTSRASEHVVQAHREMRWKVFAFLHFEISPGMFP